MLFKIYIIFLELPKIRYTHASQRIRSSVRPFVRWVYERNRSGVFGIHSMLHRYVVTQPERRSATEYLHIYRLHMALLHFDYGNNMEMQN